MKYILRPALPTLFFLGLSVSLFSQNNFFIDAGTNVLFPITAKRDITPEKYRASVLSVDQMKNFLFSLPIESAISDRKETPVLEIPTPDGRSIRFHVWESPVMAPELAARFPEIKTFLGQGIDDPYATIRFDYNPYFGFHAQVLTVNGGFYIDPYAKWDITHYISYFIHDNKRVDPTRCEVTEVLNRPEQPEAGPCRGTQLFTYRLALACTGEYAIAVCAPNPATVSATMAAMVTSVNRVTGVYETELAIRMTLIANDNLLVYLDPNTDPYTNNNGATMLGQNQTNIDNVIGNANYDIGHVFSTGGGGIAGLGVVCQTGSKARGVTGLAVPIGDNFDIDYVAHEMGHQYGANHTFNSVTGSCSGNRNSSTAYEVGSSTTIMGYAGICGTDDIQPHSDPTFHTISFDEISNYLLSSGGNCPVRTNTNNTLPVIIAMNNNGANIPINTPFTLTGSATDADNDPLTYCWEEWDLGPSGAWNSGATSTTAPLFKSRLPKANGSRTFPDSTVILAGYPVNPPATMGGLKGETLPQVARTMKFRLTVRDNRAGGGGVVTGGEGCQIATTFQINTIAGTGPFIVTSPNGGDVWTMGTSQTITWNVAGTSSSPINTTDVKISLSTDGGNTFPIVLAASTPNDGSETVTVPANVTTTARVKIEAIGNIFFDISDADFSIIPPASNFDFDNPSAANITCAGPTSSTITLGTISNNGFSTPINLTASGNPMGTTVSFNPNPVNPGSSTQVTLNGTNTLSFGSYNITITGTAGSVVRTRVLTYNILPGAGPVISVQPVSQAVCAGSTVTFSVTASNVSSYQWQLSSNGGTTYTNIIGANSPSYSLLITFVSQNSYRFRVILMNQCNVTTSNVATLTVHSLPGITLTAAPLLTLLPGQTTTLTAINNPSTGGVLTTSWFYNSNPLSVTGSTYLADVEHVGTYNANIQEVWADGSVCTDQSQTVTIDAAASNKLFIFPNPNDGHFIVSYYNSGGSSTSRTITIYDSKGARIYNAKFSITGLYTLININIAARLTGIYYVVVGDSAGKKIITGRVLAR